MEKQNLSFGSNGETLCGWITKPTGKGPYPIVILTHGLSGIIDIDLAEYAEYFVADGFACMAYDHRNWGRSSGWPRSESNPWLQVNDLREAISYVRTLPEIDPNRIGLWGTSYSGGHVLTVGGLDSRVGCLVSQVPLISGSRTFGTWVPDDKQAIFRAKLDNDRDCRRRGEPPLTTKAANDGSETAELVTRKNTSGAYNNELTLRSFDFLRTYEPLSFVSSISPTPTLMVIADRDTTTPTGWQLEAYDLMGDPKELHRIDCRHYDVYMDHLDEAATAASAFYKKHL